MHMRQGEISVFVGPSGVFLRTIKLQNLWRHLKNQIVILRKINLKTGGSINYQEDLFALFFKDRGSNKNNITTCKN